MNNHVCHHLNMDENYIFLVSKVGRVGNSLSQGINVALSKYRTVGHGIVLYMAVQTWYSDSVQAWYSTSFIVQL